MPIAAPALVKSWSFSRYSDYRECPAKFKYKHLDKLSEPPSAAMARGTDIHKKAEDYAKGTLKALPPELKLMAPQFKTLKAQKIKFVEESWAFRRDWSQTQWNDWNACWLRVKMDAAYVVPALSALVIIDHKTGKFRPERAVEYTEQLELYGLAGLAQQPEIQVVSPRLWYVDEGRVHPDPEEHEIEFFRKDEDALKKKWEKRVAPMFNDRTFKPTPSENACRWCHYRKSNGGPCKFY